jgi:hypothetical protein
MFKELKLTEDLTIFTSMITNIDNPMLVRDLEYNCDISKLTLGARAGLPGTPGKQSRIQITSKNIEDIRNEILKLIISHFKLDENYLIYIDDWVFISHSENDRSGYHNHISDGNLMFIKEPPQWTLSYYVEIPNNLENNDGRLSFKTKSDEEVSFLPMENQIIMFPADVLHKPELNRKSTNKRVVYAANISILDKNKKYVKDNNTLL